MAPSTVTHDQLIENQRTANDSHEEPPAVLVRVTVNLLPRGSYQGKDEHTGTCETGDPLEPATLRCGAERCGDQ